MARKSLTIEQVLALLAETPQRIAALTADLDPAQLRARPDPDEWSAIEVLAHLRSCADVWGGCIATILAEDRPTIRAINPRSWVKRTDYPNLQFRPSWRAYTAQRADLLALLESAPPEGWSRSATVTGAGKPLERTMHFYAQWLARHERTHVKQFKHIVETVQG